MKRCRFVKVKNGLSLSQIVAFFPSGSVGCSRCSGTRLSLHFLQFWSDVACRQEPLEGLVYALSRDFWNQVTTCCLDKPNRFASHCPPMPRDHSVKIIILLGLDFGDGRVACLARGLNEESQDNPLR